MRFENRTDAGRRLAAKLGAYRGTHPLVLAIPRGGVPLGREVADALDGELDVVLVRKLGAPYNPEFAAGSVGESGKVIVARICQTCRCGRPLSCRRGQTPVGTYPQAPRTVTQPSAQRAEPSSWWMTVWPPEPPCARHWTKYVARTRPGWSAPCPMLRPTYVRSATNGCVPGSRAEFRQRRLVLPGLQASRR